MRSDHSIAMLCGNLEVSPSGFYDWDRRRQRPGARSLADQALVEQITVIHAESRQTYGSPRIVDELHDLGHRHGRNRIARLMKSQGIPDFRPPPKIPKYIDTSGTLDDVVEYDLIDSGI